MTKPKLPWMKMILYLPFALVNIAAGLFVLLLVVPFLIPVAGFLFVLAAAPYAWWLSEKIHADVAYADRDHSLNEGEDMPWESEDGSITEDQMLDIILNSNGRGSI